MIIDGKKIAKEMRMEIKEKLSKIDDKIVISAIIIGEDYSAESYLKMLKKSCENVGFEYNIIRLKEETSEEEVLNLLDDLNGDVEVGGIIVQMPIPKHIDQDKIYAKIDPIKDVDGFNPINSGRLFKGQDSMVPCTAQGVMKAIEAIDYDLNGRDVVIVGRSNIVGKPLIHLFMEKNATVTVCHSRTKNIDLHLKRADLIVVAIGKKHFLKAEMISEGAVIIDVGINYEDGKICGDVDFEDVKEKASYITPVPGGIGPITNACLMKNTLKN